MPFPANIHDHDTAELDAQVTQQLSLLNYPPNNWVTPRKTSAGEEVVDVVIIGGGQCGLAAAFSLYRLGISNIRIVERNRPGNAGPWVNFARMETLRSPKHLLGPACGIPALTFQSWYRACFGDAAWDELDKIPRPQWQQYLEWYRRVLKLDVEYDKTVTLVSPEDNWLGLTIDGAEGREQVVARKVVLATGMSGLGKATIPSFLEGINARLWSHSSWPIDFDALCGKKVVVVGMGSSAMDNAAEALEHGASEVHLLARRATMPTINKLMGIGSPGLVEGYPTLSPAWRWKIMAYARQQQTPAPHGSTLRVSRHSNAFFHFNAGIQSVVERNDGLEVTTLKGDVFNVDYLIAATGFHTDFSARAELSLLSGHIARWRDRYTPPDGHQNAGLSEAPWLAEGFNFTERVEGELPALRNVHAFNAAAFLSLGKVSGDIPGVSVGAGWLARHIAADLYAADIDIHWQELLDYSKPELDGSEWCDADTSA